MIEEKNYDIETYDTPAYKSRKRHLGDRSDGRLVKTLPSMTYVTSFIMKRRSDALNYFEDLIDITNAERYLDQKHREGYTDMTLLHVIIAAYVRTVCERPGINRFISGQRIYARNAIEMNMVVKKEMSLESPDTCIKVYFDPRDNAVNIYKKFQKTAAEAIAKNTDFDKTAGFMRRIPRFLLRFGVSMLKFLDYYGLLPKSLLKVSPFHGSMILTSMGSLGIPAIFHHIYDFGNLPIFLSYGSIFSADAIKRDGTSERHHFVTFRVVTDERICDGYYYASAMKRLKRYVLHPELLDMHGEPTEDVD